jgi:hypothetical protein
MSSSSFFSCWVSPNDSKQQRYDVLFPPLLKMFEKCITDMENNDTLDKFSVSEFRLCGPVRNFGTAPICYPIPNESCWWEFSVNGVLYNYASEETYLSLLKSIEKLEYKHGQLTLQNMKLQNLTLLPLL